MFAESLSTVILLAVIVEIITNVFKAIFPVIKGKGENKKGSQLTAAVIGIILCLTTQIGILNKLNINIYYPVLDYIITGLIISRGSNAVHDIISIFNKTKSQII